MSMFGSRKDLLVAALEMPNDEELEALQAMIASVSDPLECLHALLDFSVEGTNGRSSWLLWLEFWLAAARDAHLNHLSRAVQDQWRAAFTKVLQDGARSGVFRPDLDPADTTILVLAIIDGVSLAIILQDPAADLTQAKRLVRAGVDRLILT